MIGKWKCNCMIGRSIQGMVYGIYVGDELRYIGSHHGEDIQKRYSQHMTNIKKDKHKFIKSSEVAKVRFEVLCNVFSDSFMLEFVEMLYISLYSPKNKCIANGHTYKSCKESDAENSLKALEKQFVIERWDNSDIKYELCM